MKFSKANFKWIIQIAFCFYINLGIAQLPNKFLKTTEYTNDNLKRRDIYLDSNLLVIKEDYYESNIKNTARYKVLTVEYFDEHRIKRLIHYSEKNEIKLLVDFEKGIYDSFEDNVFLRFTGNFIFNGIQHGNKIVVNYKNGKRDGKLIQTDSAVSGKKIALSQVADLNSLRFNIIKFYNQPYEINTFKLYNGVILHFEEDMLNGIQTSYYSNSDIKFSILYKNFRLCEYESYSIDRSIISRIKTINGISDQSQIINGIVMSSVNDNYLKERIFYLRKISSTGKIFFNKSSNGGDSYPVYVSPGLEDCKFQLNQKKIFDSKKGSFSQNEPNGMYSREFEDMEGTYSENIRKIFSIPRFQIVTLDLSSSEDNNLDIIYFNSKLGDSISANNIVKYNYPIPGGESEIDKYYILPKHINNDEVIYLPDPESGPDKKLELENDELIKYLRYAFRLKL